MQNLTFIGAGKMAEALLKGLLQNKLFKPSEITLTDVSAQRLTYFSKTYKCLTNSNNLLAIKKAEVIILAVKPQVLATVLAEISGNLSADQLLISIVAGAKIETIDPKNKFKVVRAMPNTPCLIGEGMTAVSANKKVTKKELETALSLFKAVGKVLVVDEKDLNAVTGLSGSGPAFVFRLLEAFINAGENLGLTKKTAQQLAVQTFVGSAKLAEQSDLSLEELVEQVTSPNGTTAAGRKILENSDLAKIMIDTITAAKKRADELGLEKPEKN